MNESIKSGKRDESNYTFCCYFIFLFFCYYDSQLNMLTHTQKKFFIYRSRALSLCSFWLWSIYDHKKMSSKRNASKLYTIFYLQFFYISFLMTAWEHTNGYKRRIMKFLSKYLEFCRGVWNVLGFCQVVWFFYCWKFELVWHEFNH